jgi:hypothetical protein
MPSIFVSHASKNFKLADDIRRRLEELGKTCWIAPRDIPPGSSYGEVITQAIQSCTAVVLVLTEDANVSRGVANEIEMAFREDRVIIPVRLKEIEPSAALAFYVNNTQWVDACRSPLRERVQEIIRIVDAVETGKPPPPPGEEPTGMMAALERHFEAARRSRLLVGGIAALVIGAIAAFGAERSMRSTNLLEREQAAIDADTTTYGLVSLQGAPTREGQQLRVAANLFTNLRDPAAAQVKWRGLAAPNGQAPTALDLSGVIAQAAPGAQVLALNLPAGTAKFLLCMTARHPRDGRVHTARWSFAVTGEADTLSAQRAAAPSLVLAGPKDCVIE